MPSGRVVVTGLGAMAATGMDAAAIWQSALDGRGGIGAMRGLPADNVTTRIAGELPGYDPAHYFAPRRLALLDRAAQLALIAGREAVRHSGLEASDPTRVGVIMGAASGQETIDAGYRTLYGEGSPRVHPFTVPRTMASAGASQISMEHKLRGPSFSIASACASATHAIGLAFHMIRSGLLDAAVTGGGDASLCYGFVKAWEALRALSADACRPFSRDRSGLVLGEGAAVLVLEDHDRARARGAAIHAEIVGFGMSADAGDLTAPDAAGAAQAIRAALADAQMPADAVGYVNAHGTGTRLNDRTEAAALQAVFGDRALPVSSSKSLFGHCMTASGALEAVMTVLALREGVLPPTIGFREPDPECPVDCVPNTARRMPIRTALSNSFAFGGLNAVLAFRAAA